MTIDKYMCPICAWRRDCNKKFSRGDTIHCPDYTRDLMIRDRSSAEKPEEKAQISNKTSKIRFL